MGKKAIIIGSGVAGMATAIRLRSKGKEVLVVEKNNYPGGKLSSFKLGEFHFDAGPSLFTLPNLLENLFASAGEKLDNHLIYKKVPISCTYFFEDGIVFRAFQDKNLLKEEIHNTLNIDESDFFKYLSDAENSYKHIGKIFLENSLHQSRLFSKKNQILDAIKHTKPAYLFESMSTYHQKKINEAHLVQILNRFATYNGSNPYKAPAMLSMISHLDFNDGVYYPEGGMISIRNALYHLCLKLGVDFLFGNEVTQIEFDKKRVKGIKTAVDTIKGDIVVSNMDVFYTYKHLLKDNKMSDKILEQERSSSALIFYWGINSTFEELGLHNIFFSTNYPGEFESLFQTKGYYEDLTVYINITSKESPCQHAPQGMENWFVMVNVPSAEKDWDSLQHRYRLSVIKKLTRILKKDIEKMIIEETVLTPHGISINTKSYLGALYGTSSNSPLSAFMRHPNFSDRYKGLYFTGGTVHPGGGIPLCLHSAEIVSNIIQLNHPN